MQTSRTTDARLSSSRSSILALPQDQLSSHQQVESPKIKQFFRNMLTLDDSRRLALQLFYIANLER